MRVALASRELYPLGGGGIGQFVAAAAKLLSQIAEVTIVTTSVYEPAYRRLRARRDPRLPPSSVRVAFVAEPSVEEAAGWYHVMHCYGSRLMDRLRELYPDGGPDLLEFPDFLGEAFVPLQAAETLDPLLRDSCLCVRVHTSAEICEVLDGYFKHDVGSQALHAMERYSLDRADRLIWQGGGILETYRRFYGGRLAPAIRIRYPYAGPWLAEGQADDAHVIGRPLRLLYAGRLERRKGVQDLVRAITGLGRDDFRLTLIGGDTDTAPLGVSMRSALELEIAEDPRIQLVPSAERKVLARRIREHDVVVIPSRWECWPYAALEPMHLNRPVLATPVGGLVELVQQGHSGWLSRACGPVALEEALVRLLDAPQEVQAMIRGHRPAARVRELTDDRRILDGYQALLRDFRAVRGRPGGGSAPPRGAKPLVSAIVPYYRASRFLRETVDSLLAQTYPRLEVIIVDDGSFEDEDWLVAELAASLPLVVVTQMNQGLGAARNFGISQTRGRYVFPLDADNIAEPEFVARCVEILEGRPELAYVTSWSRYIDPDSTPRTRGAIGYQPLGNHAALNAVENVAGDAAALLRRRIFDAGFRYSEELASFEDWHLYRELQRAGHHGAIIPERLIRYRVREDSMQAEYAQPRRERLRGEIEAHIRENEIEWTSSSA